MISNNQIADNRRPELWPQLRFYADRSFVQHCIRSSKQDFDLSFLYLVQKQYVEWAKSDYIKSFKHADQISHLPDWVIFCYFSKLSVFPPPTTANINIPIEFANAETTLNDNSWEWDCGQIRFEFETNANVEGMTWSQTFHVSLIALGKGCTGVIFCVNILLCGAYWK